MQNRHWTSQLFEENKAYADTGGVSECNRHQHFLPAFQNSHNGHVELSRFSDGRPAPFHLLDALPQEWVLLWDLNGRACQLKEHIVSGFVRHSHFYTRKQAADYLQSIVF